mmetsp:Transcript_20834/g.48340  ORF Transcript_20834/g.48340 Transcript_20834/m.48340 type:complete len:608 (+) Transcript_20834:282-2105(+)
MPPKKKKEKGSKAIGRRLAKFSHLQGKKLLDVCSREFDMVVQQQVEDFHEACEERLDVASGKLDGLEGHMASIVAHQEMRVAEAHQQQVEAVDSERQEKKILCQWLNGFLVSAGEEPNLDPIDFAFARFALNMAIAADHTPVAKMTEARVPSFLVGMLSSSNDIVLGPSAIALCHLSLHSDAKVPIVEVGAIPPIARNLRVCPSPAVLTQLAKCLASLAQNAPNKARIAGDEGMAALVELCAENSDFVDSPRCTHGVRAACLSALVNLTFQSDSNRNLLVELDGLQAIVEACMNSPDSHVIEQACRALGNIAFNSSYTAQRILQKQGSEALCSAVTACDVHADDRILEAAMIAVANLCNNETNQTHVGAGEAIKLAVHLCKHSPHPHVLRAAANCVTSLSFKSFINKTRLGEQDAIPALLHLIEKHGFGNLDKSEPFVWAVEAACRALGSLLLHGVNQFIMRDLWGLKTMVELCLTTEDMPVLHAASMSVCAMCPNAEERFDAHDEGRPLQTEQLDTIPALGRVKNFLFGRTQPPDWLTEAIRTVALDEDELRKEKTKALQRGERMDDDLKEYVIRTDLFEERGSLVLPDHAVETAPELSSLSFKAY